MGQWATIFILSIGFGLLFYFAMAWLHPYCISCSNRANRSSFWDVQTPPAQAPKPQNTLLEDDI